MQPTLNKDFVIIILLQICFIFMDNGAKRADVSSFSTMFIILYKKKTSTSSLVLMHPNKRFFWSVCTTLSAKFCINSLTIPPSQTHLTKISISFSSLRNASTSSSSISSHLRNPKGQYFHLVELHQLKLFYIHL